MDFVHGFDYVTYLKGREDGRIAARKAKEEAEKVNKPKRRGRPRKIKPEQTAQTAESL
jgi:transposase